MERFLPINTIKLSSFHPLTGIKIGRKIEQRFRTKAPAFMNIQTYTLTLVTRLWLCVYAPAILKSRVHKDVKWLSLFMNIHARKISKPLNLYLSFNRRSEDEVNTFYYLVFPIRFEIEINWLILPIQNYKGRKPHFLH